jgi:hypothetical protein
LTLGRRLAGLGLCLLLLLLLGALKPMTLQSNLGCASSTGHEITVHVLIHGNLHLLSSRELALVCWGLLGIATGARGLATFHGFLSL